MNATRVYTNIDIPAIIEIREMGCKRFFRRAVLETSDFLKDDCLKINCIVGVVVSTIDCSRLPSIEVPEFDPILVCYWTTRMVRILYLMCRERNFMLIGLSRRLGHLHCEPSSSMI
ncbi:hypothetical protein MKX01_036218 [Papaver californicum]|nr:hypothetical protein MKX01_036218 [Papaver californicum]